MNQTDEQKDETIKRLRREIRVMQLALEERNLQLNAYHHVWCTGGCEGGIKDKTALSEELVRKAEYQTSRLRSYWENYQYRHPEKSNWLMRFLSRF